MPDPFDTPAFRSLHTAWMRVLRDECYDDIENGRRDGNGHLSSPLAEGAMFAPEPDILAQCADESAELIGATDAIAYNARAVLYNEALWVLLPREARLWWGLQVISGWSADRAGRLLRVSSRQYLSWERTIRHMRSYGFDGR